MGVTVPPGFGLAAFHLTADFGTPDFVTTIGLDLSVAGGDFEAAVEAAYAAYATTIMTQTLTSYTLTGCSLTVGQDGSSVGSLQSASTPIPGSRSGQSEAAAMAVIARKMTAQLGRRGRGRMYVPGWLEVDQAQPSGEMVPGVFTALQDALDDFYDALQGDEGVTSPLNGAVLLHADGGAPTPITALQLVTKVGWIRKRIR